MLTILYFYDLLDAEASFAGIALKAPPVAAEFGPVWLELAKS